MQLILIDFVVVGFHVSNLLLLSFSIYLHLKALTKKLYISPNLWYLSGISSILWVLFLIGMLYHGNEEIIMKYQFIFFFVKTILWLYLLFTTMLVCLIKSKPSLNYQISFEVVVFIALSVQFLILLISANSFIYIFIILALISICSFALCYNKRGGRQTSLLYYFLSAIGSGFLLFGISFIYYVTGCENLSDLSFFLQNNTLAHGKLSMLKFGYIFFVCGLFIKMGTLVPFHIWISEVYNTTKSYIVIYFASIPVLGILAVLIRVNMALGYSFLQCLQFFFFGISIVTVFVGIIGAAGQVKLKKIFAYSSVGNIGFIMALFSTVTMPSYATIIFYIFLYSVSVFCFWSLLTVFEYNMNLKINDFKDLSRLYHSGIIGKRNCIYLLVFLFSSIGVPPLAGFFSKYFLFLQLVHQGHYWLLSYFILMSCFSAFYFLRIVITIVLPKDRDKGSFFYRAPHDNIDIGLILATMFHIFFFCLITLLMVRGLVASDSLYFFYKGI